MKSKTVTITVNYETPGNPPPGGGGNPGGRVDPTGRGFDPLGSRTIGQQVAAIIERLRKSTKGPKEFAKALRGELGKAVDRYEALRNDAATTSRNSAGSGTAFSAPNAGHSHTVTGSTALNAKTGADGIPFLGINWLVKF